MAPVVAALVTAAAAVTTTVMSNNAAKKQQQRQLDYQRQLNEEQKQTAAQEQQLRTESLDRQKAYSLSLLDNNTTLNSLGNIPDDETLGSSNDVTLNTTDQQTGVQSMFA